MNRNASSWWGQAVQNRVVALVLAMMVLVPLVASPANRAFQGASALVFGVFSVVLLGALMWRAKWDLRREKIAAFVKTGPNAAVLAFAGIIAVSAILAPAANRGYAMQELLRYTGGLLLYFVVAYQFRRSEHLTKLVDVTLFVGIVAAMVGIAQFGMSGEHRASGVFGNAQLYASFLLIILPLTAVIAVSEKGNRQLLAQVATVMVVAGLLLSMTRSAWIGGAASLLTLSAMVLAGGRNRAAKVKSSKHLVVLPVMLLTVGVGFFLLLSPQTTALVERGSTLSDISRVNTLNTRRQLWYGASRMIAAKPLTGWGVGQFSVYQNTFTNYGIPRTDVARPSLSENAHSMWLQTGAELGIPGLLAMAAVVITFLVTGIRRVREMDYGIRRGLLMASIAAVVGFSIDALSNPAWMYGQVSMFLWLMLGVGVGAIRPAPSRREETEPVLVPIRFSRTAGALATLALAALLPSVSYAGGDGYPIGVRIDPKGATIQGGMLAYFTLYLVYDNDDEIDVSENSVTTRFSKTGGIGFMTGPNLRAYQSQNRENSNISVRGRYSAAGVGPFTDFAPLAVRP